MNSLILRTGVRLLIPLMCLFSIFLLLRGHNEPGGGFVGGLVAAAAFSLYAIAYDVEAAERLLRISPFRLIGTGLLIAAASGVFSTLFGSSFMTGKWGKFHVPGLGLIELGTPVFFDIGVYLVVVGVTVMIIFSLAEEE